jgi:hypothetical protein
LKFTQALQPSLAPVAVDGQKWPKIKSVNPAKEARARLASHPLPANFTAAIAAQTEIRHQATNIRQQS